MRSSLSGFIPSLILMAAASASVIITLEVYHSIWTTFLTYHVGICLMLPLAETLFLRRASVGEHMRRVGITGGNVRAGIAVGIVCAVALGGGIAASFALFGHRFLGQNRAALMLMRWGLEPERIWLMMTFMVLMNGLAEELFWRGYVHRRLERLQPRWFAIGLAALFYASYHPLTIGSLLHDPMITVFFSLAVVVAGCLWGWLREKYDSVWPALLAHVGATAGYMIVYWTSIAGGSS